MRIAALVLPVAVALAPVASHAQGKPADKPAAAPAAPAAPAAKADDKKGGEMKAGDAKAAAPAAGAPAAAAPAMPTPAPELAASMKGMEGTWNCKGDQKPSAFGPGHPVKGKMTMKSDLGGFWYMWHYEESKSKDSPMPYMMTATIGFDPTSKKLVRTDLDNLGGFTHSMSAGWEGDKEVWTGDAMMGPQKMPFRETLTKKSDKEVLSVVEMGDGKGAFTVLVEQTCKK